MRIKKRWIIIGAVAAIVLLVAVFSMGGSAVTVETAVVGVDTVRVTVTDEGRTRVRDTYVLAAPVGGRLARIDLDEGDEVGQGQVLARIFPTPAGTRERSVSEAQLAAAEARRLEVASRLAEATARVNQADREAERRQGLAESGVISREAFERAQLEAESARRQLDSMEAGLRAAEADVASARAALAGVSPSAGAGEPVDVRAPAAGRLLNIYEQSERVVAPGTPLAEIGDARGLEVVVDVLTADAVTIAPGDPVRIDDWGGPQPIEGRVRNVEPAAFTEISALGVEEQRVNVIIDLIDPPPALGAGYRVEAQIATWIGPDVVAVPTSALFQQDEDWHVFVVQDGRARLQAVEIGQRSTDLAQVLDGIEAGTEVILFPSDQISDGVRVAG